LLFASAAISGDALFTYSISLLTLYFSVQLVATVKFLPEIFHQTLRLNYYFFSIQLIALLSQVFFIFTPQLSSLYLPDHHQLQTYSQAKSLF